MKVLLDACVPRPLRRFLSSHIVQTAQEMGWSELKNGALSQVAEPQFDAFITTDKNLRYQQNLSERKIAVLVLPTNDWPELRAHTREIAARVDQLESGEFIELELERR